MGKRKVRFIAKAEAGEGWRIWDRTGQRWWGNAYQHYPEQLLAELNGDKRPEKLTALARATPKKEN